jgi:hypothetical protein
MENCTTLAQNQRAALIISPVASYGTISQRKHPPAPIFSLSAFQPFRITNSSNYAEISASAKVISPQNSAEHQVTFPLSRGLAT